MDVVYYLIESAISHLEELVPWIILGSEG